MYNYSDRLDPYIGNDDNLSGGYVNQGTTSGKTFKITSEGPVISQRYASHKPYNIETFNLKKGDVILLHLHEDLDLDDTRMILEDMEKVFPDNTVLVANEYILKGLTILRLPPPEVGEVNMFDEEIGAPGFLENWLKKDLEY